MLIISNKDIVCCVFSFVFSMPCMCMCKTYIVDWLPEITETEKSQLKYTVC